MSESPSTGVTRVCGNCQQVYGYKEKHVCPKGGAAEVPADPLIGATLGGRYLIESFLSSGGMGVVYRAKHSVLDKPLAIKLLREAQDPMMQQRFLLEAKSACHIGHENIVDITDFGVLDDGRPYLVMEFLQGQSLESVIAKGALPPLRSCRIAEQIARGLHAVHEKGIVHRDLKPGNIFILERGRKDFVKILDFGIAKVMAGTRESLSGGANLPNLRATATGTVLGTPEYLSPEQGAGEAFDARVDQYALGCIMYEMLTGQVPFRGNGPMSTLMKHLTEKPVPPRKRRADLNIPESLEKIVLKAMAQQKENRYASMDELANVLQELIDSGTLPPDPAMMRPSSSLQTVATSPSPGTPSAQPELSPLTSGDMFAPTLQAAIPSKADIAKEKARLKENPSGIDPKPHLATERVPPIVLSKRSSLPVVLLGVAGVMVLLLVAVLAVKLGGGSKSHATEAADLGAGKSVMPSLGEPAAPKEQKISFENQSTGKVTLLCGSKKNCILDVGKSCELVLPEDTKCEASATGFRSQSVDVADAIRGAGKGKAVLIPIQLDADKPAGKAGKVKKTKAKSKKR